MVRRRPLFFVFPWLACFVFGFIWIVPPGWFIYQPGNDWRLILDAILGCFIWPYMGVIVSSMVADQIDADEAENNVRRKGLFASSQNWIIAISGSVAMIGSGLV